MLLWQLFLIFAMIFIIVEIFVPMMFFVNFALGCIVSAVVSVYCKNVTVLIVLTVFLSGIFLYLLRPFLMKKLKSNNTGVEDKYIGKIVKVIEPINSNGGAITIYGERWNAKSDVEIAVGEEVKIVKNDSLVFYVEKYKE